MVRDTIHGFGMRKSVGMNYERLLFRYGLLMLHYFQRETGKNMLESIFRGGPGLFKTGKVQSDLLVVPCDTMLCCFQVALIVVLFFSMMSYVYFATEVCCLSISILLYQNGLCRFTGIMAAPPPSSAYTWGWMLGSTVTWLACMVTTLAIYLKRAMKRISPRHSVSSKTLKYNGARPCCIQYIC